MPTPNETSKGNTRRAVLELVTGDPMGAVRHVAACLARRAYPLLGLICLPEAGGAGRLVVAVADDGRLERLMAELSGLPEVADARFGDPTTPTLAAFMGDAAAA
jgi:acetolactate synthase I/III small subunit